MFAKKHVNEDFLKAYPHLLSGQDIELRESRELMVVLLRLLLGM